MADFEKLQALMGQYISGGVSIHQFYQIYNQQLYEQQQLQQHPEQQEPLELLKKEVNLPQEHEKPIKDSKQAEWDNLSKFKEEREENLDKDHLGPTRRPVMHLERVRHKRQTLQDMARPLKHWLYQHRDNPYPTKAEKLTLANNSQMTLTQVSNWFANARRRLKNTVRDPELSWENRIRLYNSCVEGNQELLSIDSEDSGSICDEAQGMLGDHSDTPQAPAPTAPEGPPTPTPASPPQDPIPSPPPAASPVLPPDEATHTTPAASNPTTLTLADSRNELITEEQGAPHKYKHCILQRYLTDSYQHSLQQQQQQQQMAENEAGSRHRNPSGSLSSHDFEEISTSFTGSPMREHQFEEHCDEYEEFSRQWPSIENRAEDDLYWKEISAALALTSLARSRIGPTTGREDCRT